MKLSSESLAKIEADIKELLSGDFKFSELIAVVEDLITLIRTTQTIDNPNDAIDEAKEAWTFLNDKYGIIQKIDDLVKLPSIVENFDSMLIGILINQIVIPMSIKALWKL